jgi:glutathione S-transferase
MLRPDFANENAQNEPPNQTHDDNFFAPGQPGEVLHEQQQFGMSVAMVNTNIPPGHPGATGQRYYTIQRVNGNGGNGKGDGVAGPHKHTLAHSDQVKKNSIQRLLLKKDKEEKKTQVSSHAFSLAWNIS